MRSNNYNYPSEEFCKLVDQMELSNLEDLIIGLAENMSCNSEKIERCLMHRKFVLHKQFECSSENIVRFGEVMLMLKERTAAIFNATKSLYRQLHKQWQEGNTCGFSDFMIETSLRIAVENNDSELRLDEGTKSRYCKMADILDRYYQDHWGGNLVDVTLYYKPDMQYEDFNDKFFYENFGCHYDEFYDDWAEDGFKRDFSQLSQFPFPYAAHQMLFHANYTLQDVIRVKAFYSEIKVTYDL